eukprot:GFKZ01012848.1.p1 GENE.GFKZ01012848.1~~GFKZ01012848.1.p1  ORF type:complete len:475 (-),score=79.72 GFKZ01012848.1:1170-2594(-)
MGISDSVTVKIKWSKETFDAVTIDTTESPELFKTQLWTLTGVPPPRQTIMGLKGGKLRDDSDWSKTGLKNGMTLYLMGTPDTALPPPPPTGDDVPAVRDDLDPDAEVVEDAPAVGPPGLANLGNTCYMNASVQCLRAVTPLVGALGEYTGNSRASDPAERFSASLRDVMKELNTSNRNVTPFAFLNSLRSVNPQFAERGPHGMFMQQDAEECWGEMLTRLASSLLLRREQPQEGNFVDKMFGIRMKGIDKCGEGDDAEVVEREENVRALKCHISVNVNHLSQGVREGLEETIEKHSDRLGRTAEWKRTAKMDKIPPFLIVQFVRFFWKPAERVKAKILRNVSFPIQFDVYDFCTEELQEKLKVKRDEAKAKADQSIADGGQSSTAEGEEEMADAVDEELVAETGNYELQAVLTHQGRAADAGHYVAWVREKGTRWHKFDDANVSAHAEEDVKKLSGGGDWHMAYMCVYRAKNSF